VPICEPTGDMWAHESTFPERDTPVEFVVSRRNRKRALGHWILASTTAAALLALTGCTGGHISVSPPTSVKCERDDGIACLSPRQYQRIYDVRALLNRGINGRGVTVAVVGATGDPNIKQSLATFDAAFHLPPPPNLTVITPAGQVSLGNTANSSEAIEQDTDVESVHAMAPKAGILVVETPHLRCCGPLGLAPLTRAANYVINHHLAEVISESFATAESFPVNPYCSYLHESITRCYQSVTMQAASGAIRNAFHHHVTFLASSGDEGPTMPERRLPDGRQTYFQERVVAWPAEDPLVTSVGGTRLRINRDGSRGGPAQAWNDTKSQELGHSPEASGGGLSGVFSRPHYQDNVRRIVHDRRGVPDISMAADPNGGLITYQALSEGRSRWFTSGGTSQACPLFAGIVALADQAAGHALGFLNPMLYKLATNPSNGIIDVTEGNTTVTFRQQGRRYRVRGYQASAGYDLATGLGTVDGAKLVPALVRLYDQRTQ
jgi:subtilase family serine protease